MVNYTYRVKSFNLFQYIFACNMIDQIEQKIASRTSLFENLGEGLLDCRD